MARANLTDKELQTYWEEIPIGKENAISYANLMLLWGKDKRNLRKIMHELGRYDCGDNYVLVRSGCFGCRLWGKSGRFTQY